jgi:hypothetical protein
LYSPANPLYSPSAFGFPAAAQAAGKTEYKGLALLVEQQQENQRPAEQQQQENQNGILKALLPYKSK